MLTAVAVEIPIAGLLLAASLLILRRVIATVAMLRGRRGARFSLWAAPMVMLDSPALPSD